MCCFTQAVGGKGGEDAKGQHTGLEVHPREEGRPEVRRIMNKTTLSSPYISALPIQNFAAA